MQEQAARPADTARYRHEAELLQKKAQRLLDAADRLDAWNNESLTEDVRARRHICVECQEIFITAREEREWYARKGFSVPRRCPLCREQLKEFKRAMETGA